MVKFAHIAPTRCLEPAMHKSQIHMALYHIARADAKYARSFRNTDKEVILDNSWFELGETPPIEDLIEVAKLVQATYVIMPDGTLDGMKELKAAGFKVMAVPAGPNMLEQAEMWLRNADIAKVAISFTHASAAMGVDKLNPSARYEVMRHLDEKWTELPLNRIHFLGMGDSVHEVMLVKPWWPNIYSWDTSAAVWGGLHKVDLAHSKRKFNLSVDFHSALEWNEQCGKNCSYINKMTKKD